MVQRKNKLDLIINVFDNFLKTNFGGLVGSGRNSPAVDLVASHEKEDINPSWELSGKLMRINHSGEVAAQGLYQGQLFLETDPALRNYLNKAAKEEAECKQETESRFARAGTAVNCRG